MYPVHVIMLLTIANSQLQSKSPKITFKYISVYVFECKICHQNILMVLQENKPIMIYKNQYTNS